MGIKLYYADSTEVQHGGVHFTEEICGSGYYRICNVRSPSEFVDAERVNMAVTFACAMTRRRTFEQLGGWTSALPQ